jgi:nucleoside-triphosphatase
MAIRILLTGEPGCGKTTVIEKVLELYSGPAGGFITREVRKAGRRFGFELISLDGRRGTLASVDFESELRVGKYRVDIQILDSIGVDAIKKSFSAGELIVIDEIGSMEILSDLFCRTVKRIFTSEIDLIGTISRRNHPFLNEIKKLPAIELIRVDHNNRDELVGLILSKLMR